MGTMERDSDPENSTAWQIKGPTGTFVIVTTTFDFINSTVKQTWLQKILSILEYNIWEARSIFFLSIFYVYVQIFITVNLINKI